MGMVGAEEKGKISASFIVRREFDDGDGKYKEADKIINIGDIQIQPGFKGKGLGKTMLMELEKVARQLGASKMVGKVTTSDLKETPWLLEFYKKRGFEVQERNAGWEITKSL